MPVVQHKRVDKISNGSEMRESSLPKLKSMRESDGGGSMNTSVNQREKTNQAPDERHSQNKFGSQDIRNGPVLKFNSQNENLIHPLTEVNEPASNTKRHGSNRKSDFQISAKRNQRDNKSD